VTDPETTLVIG